MIFCVTGPMAAGKNAACDLLAERGVAVADADVLVHDVLALPRVRDRIVAEFGTLAAERGIALVAADGSLDRRGVGRLVFTDAALVRRQEAIVYPELTGMVEAFIARNASAGHVAVNAAVLYKIPALMERMACVLYVDAPAIVRWFRSRRRDGLSSRRIRERFRAQRNLFAKYAACGADIVRVWNTGSRSQLEKKIERFLSWLDR